MKKSEPLVDKDGEVRELLVDDIRQFRPIAEVAASSLAAKLGVQTKQAASPTDEAQFLSGKQGEAGVKAALSRKRSTAARKAWQTRRRSTG
jgi:hypothetical protein